MTKAINIKIENKFFLERRDMNVYHHATKSAHMISYNSSVTLPFEPAAEGDYLYISVVGGPGDLVHTSLVDLPAWVNFQFLSPRQLTVMRWDERIFLKIPPGPPGWKLKLTGSNQRITLEKDHITIGEDSMTEGVI